MSTAPFQDLISTKYFKRRIASTQNLPRQQALDIDKFNKHFMTMEFGGNGNYSAKGFKRTFPDNVIPFPIDSGILDVLVPRFADVELGGEEKQRSRSKESHSPSTRQPRRRSPRKLGKSKSTSALTPSRQIPFSKFLQEPPIGSSERVLAIWLNKVGDIIEEEIGPKVREYRSLEDKICVIPKRRWTAMGADKPITAGSPFGLRRKPDVALVETVDDEIPTLNWSNILALCETSATTYSKNPNIRNTVDQKSYCMFTEQDNRSFIPAIILAGDEFSLRMYDRCGWESTRRTTRNGAADLLRTMGCLFFGRPATIGFDETITCIDGKATKVLHCGDIWNIDFVLHKSDSIVGRATKCWAVSRDVDGHQESLVMKDSWPQSHRADAEPKVLERIKKEKINGGRSLPQLHSWERVFRPFGNKKFSMLEASTLPRETRKDSRVHCRQVFGPRATTIDGFVSLKDLIGAFIDIVDAHEALWNAGILHRDISANNLMLIPRISGNTSPLPSRISGNTSPLPSSSGDPHRTQHPRGILIDMDYACDFGSSQEVYENGVVPDTLLDPTGTMPFMSIQLLMESGRKPHHARNDLESLFYVLLFMCIMYAGPLCKQKFAARDADSHNHPFGVRYDAVDMAAMGQAKISFFNDRETTTNDVLRYVDSYFQPLKALIEELCDEVFQVSNDGMRNPRRPRGTHAKFRQVLYKHYDLLPELDANPHANKLEKPDTPTNPNNSSSTSATSSSFPSLVRSGSAYVSMNSAPTISSRQTRNSSFPSSVRSGSAYVSTNPAPTSSSRQTRNSSASTMVLRSGSPTKRSSAQTGRLDEPKRMRTSASGSGQ